MEAGIHLSDWLDWSDRISLPNCAGLYVISKGDRNNVVYVGRTWSAKGIRHRISAFHRSATTGNSGHAGGVTYNSVFGVDITDLFVRCHEPKTINPDPKILHPYIEYAERKLIWEHVEKFGELPVCNSQ